MTRTRERNETDRFGKRAWLRHVVVVCIGAVATTTIDATGAIAQPKPVPPQRWVRQVCSGWSKYADVDTAAFASVDGVLSGLQAGDLKPKKALERLIRSQENRVHGISDVVLAVQNSGTPSTTSGADVRRAYLDTVKQYRSVETQQLGEYQKLAPSAPDELRLAVQGAEGRRSDRIDTIGYDPLEQLKSSSELAPAIDGAAACGDVAEWIDLSGLSDYRVGQCLKLNGNATLHSFELRDTEEVACTEPHPLEVFVQTQYPNPAGDPYPGDAALQAFAENQCTGEAFADYVGRDFDSSSLDAHSLYPDDQGWKANNRELLCILSPTNGEPTTGSARASGR